MRRPIGQLLVGAVALAAPLFVSSAALADKNAACGNIDFSAGLSCEILLSGGCTTQCTPINFTAECDGECTASATADCNTSCEATCNSNCTVNPGSFDCSADCDGQCSGYCSASSDMATCQASCQGECSAKCTATPPTADCTTKCQADCSGQCTFSANVDCDVMCSTTLTGGCNTQCQQPSGALFCNGQYVSAQSIDDCVKWLETQFSITVTGYANASGSCSGNSCQGEADAGCSAGSIANAPLDGAAAKSALAALAAAVGLTIARRRRRNKKS